MKKKLPLKYLVLVLIFGSCFIEAKKNKNEKIWNLDMLNNMSFSGGIGDILSSKSPSMYQKLYIFGDSFSDSGNLLGTRFVPNQWPFPLGSGVHVWGEPLSIIFTHQIPYPILHNQSFPTARMANGPFNVRQRVDWFLDLPIWGTNIKNYQNETLFVFWAGFNDAKQFIEKNRFNVFHYPKPNFNHDVRIYVDGIKRISALNGDIIVMNIPDTLVFPGGRLTPMLTPFSIFLREVSKYLHLDFNQDTSSEYLSVLHNGTGIKGLDNLIAQDLAEFKAQYRFINPDWIEQYAQAYYRMQRETVDILNQQLYDELTTIKQENIIYVDMRSFVKEMIENPEFFGFDNVKGPECGPNSSANACKTNPADKNYYYIFGDNFNFSYKAQKEIFSYLSMMITTPFVLAGLYNTLLSSNIDMNVDLINGFYIKTGNLDAKPNITLLYNRQWQLNDRIDYGYNLGFRVMNYRVPFTDVWAATSYWAPYINLKLNDYLTLGLENQTSVGYYEFRREVSFEGREAMSVKDRYEKANMSSEKILLAGTACLNYENDYVKFILRGLFGLGYALNHRYEDRTNTSTSVSFAPNNLIYLHGEIKLKIEFKKFPTNRLNFGIEGVGHYNQALNDLKLVGNIKRAPVKFKRKVKLITAYEGDWAAYFKYKPNKRLSIKYGYQGRNYNYVIRNGFFVNLQYRLD